MKIKKYTVNTNNRKNDVTYINIYPKNSIAFSWLDGLVEDLNSKFNYQLYDKADGVDEAIRELRKGSNKIRLIYDDFWGVEIHPLDADAEADLKEIGAYLKKRLESQFEEDE